MLIDVFLLVGGGVGVWIGAEGMVRGAVRLAAFLGIPSLIIGLTVVAFGTSAPELVVSVIASASGHSGIALGNVIGSNVINIGLVLGLSALICPIAVSTEVLKRDVPVLAVITVAVVAMAWIGNQVSRIDGVVLVVGFAAHTLFSYRIALREQARMTTSPNWRQPELKGRHILFLIGGTIILSAGAEGMVRGAVGVAEALGMSKRVVGMTIVAFGTSVPELAASVVAAKHGESDLALGNVVGSNIYNILLILGTASLVAPIPVHAGRGYVDFIFLVTIVFVLPVMIRVRWRLGRMDGLVLVAIYAAFNAILFIR